MQRQPYGKIFNASNGSVLCAYARFADSLWLRLRGLLGSKGLHGDAGLLLSPSSGVHTFGMRFAIDIVAMDKNFRVIGLWEMVGPGKVRALGMRTRNVLELGGGRLKEFDLALGDKLVFCPVTEFGQPDL